MIDKIAWIRLENGRILCTRSHGKDVYYLPGGKREPGETDLDTLRREIAEELAVTVVATTVTPVGVFEAPADGQPAGVVVRMSCYSADYRGTLAPSGEIAEMVWLTHTDRSKVSAVDQLIFDHLLAAGLLDRTPRT